MSEHDNPWFILGIDHGTYGRDASAAMARKLRAVKAITDAAFDRTAIVDAANRLKQAPEVPDTARWRVPAIGWLPDPPPDASGTMRPGPPRLARRTDPVDRTEAVTTAERLIRDHLIRIAANLAATAAD